MIYKKYSSCFKQYVSLLREYYHVKTIKELIFSLTEDFFVGLFLRSGSGFFTSVIKGLIAKLFIKSGYPILIGRRCRIVHPSNINMGHHVWVRDDVIMVANGKINIGNDFVLGEKSELWSINNLKIGNGVGIGKNCYLAQLGGSIEIGNQVLIADNVRIYSLSHKFEDIKTPIIFQGYKEGKIEIEDNVWIGSGVVIFNSVTIGYGSVIGANTVVTKNVPPFTVFVGNPGKIVRRLSNDAFFGKL